MGGLLQLVTVGVQDKYIHGNPQITFFKSVYRRHTNFAIESIQQYIAGKIDTGDGHIGNVTLSKGNGDLVNKIFVQVDQVDTGVNGDEVIEEVELIIGGTLIDKHTKEWMQVWRELTTPSSKSDGIKYMCNSFENNLSTRADSTNQACLMIPLMFWFCRYPGVSLPILSLQYDDILLKFKWGNNSNINKDSSSTGHNCTVWVDYIFLDREERIRFAQIEHEYLIEQLQYQDTSNKGQQTIFEMKFNHPIKELIWTENNTGANAITNQKMNITLNEIDRHALQYKEYFTLKQPFDHHTSIPGYNIKEVDRSKLLMNPILIMGGTDKCKASSGSLSGDSFQIKSTLSDDSSYDGHLRILMASGKAVEDIKIGDLLSITYPISGTGADEAITIYSTVKAIRTKPQSGSTAGEYTLNIESGSGDITTNKPPNNSINGNGSISILARTQDPTSKCSNLKKNIYVYSFSLNPEEHQPSGTMNFSRINKAKIKITEAKQIDTIYAVNYNVIRIKGGTTSLMYSN